MFDDVADAMKNDAQRHRRLCGFGRWVLTLDAADAAKAESLLRDPAYNCRQLARYFATKGATFNDQVLTRHRNGTCCGQR